MTSHLGGDELQLKFSPRHVLVIADDGPAERQRVRHHLAQRSDLDPHHVDASLAGVLLDHTGDRPAQGQLMHVVHRRRSRRRAPVPVRRSVTVTIYYRDGQRTDEVQPITLLQVYGNHAPELDSAIVEFWKTEGALPRHEDDIVLQRLSEVLFIAVNDQNEIVGVCSGIPRYFEQIRNHFLYLRAFVRPDWRGHNRGVVSSLFVATFDLFDQLKAIDGQPVIGILTVFESRYLNDVAKPYHSAKHRSLVLVGWTPRDEQVRIAYFTDVRMP